MLLQFIMILHKQLQGLLVAPAFILVLNCREDCIIEDTDIGIRSKLGQSTGKEKIEDGAVRVQQIVLAAVRKILGEVPADDSPLMRAGLDSLGDFQSP